MRNKASKPIRALLIEDEAHAQSYLLSILEEFCPEVRVLGCADSPETGKELIEQLNPDLLFLDIQMNSGTGFDLLKSLNKISFDIIFTTAYNDYSMQAIKVSALDYLLKPIDPDELIEAVAKHRRRKQSVSLEGVSALLNNLQSTSEKKIAVPDAQGITYLNLSEIIRFQGDGNYCRIFLDNGKELLSTKRIKEYENTIQNSTFFRVHQSHLIDLKKVKRYVHGKTGTAIMTDGAEIEVSRRRKTELLERLEEL